MAIPRNRVSANSTTDFLVHPGLNETLFLTRPIVGMVTAIWAWELLQRRAIRLITNTTLGLEQANQTVSLSLRHNKQSSSQQWKKHRQKILALMQKRAQTYTNNPCHATSQNTSVSHNQKSATQKNWSLLLGAIIKFPFDVHNLKQNTARQPSCTENPSWTLEPTLFSFINIV